MITALRVLSVSLHTHNGGTANGVLFGVWFFLVGAPVVSTEGGGGGRRGWNTQPDEVFVPQDLGGEAVR